MISESLVREQLPAISSQLLRLAAAKWTVGSTLLLFLVPVAYNPQAIRPSPWVGVASFFSTSVQFVRLWTVVIDSLASPPTSLFFLGYGPGVLLRLWCVSNGRFDHLPIPSTSASGPFGSWLIDRHTSRAQLPF